MPPQSDAGTTVIQDEIANECVVIRVAQIDAAPMVFQNGVVFKSVVLRETEHYPIIALIRDLIARNGVVEAV